jgi:hypothetical protein
LLLSGIKNIDLRITTVNESIDRIDQNLKQIKDDNKIINESQAIILNSIYIYNPWIDMSRQIRTSLSAKALKVSFFKHLQEINENNIPEIENNNVNIKINEKNNAGDDLKNAPIIRATCMVTGQAEIYVVCAHILPHYTKPDALDGSIRHY